MIVDTILACLIGTAVVVLCVMAMEIAIRGRGK